MTELRLEPRRFSMLVALLLTALVTGSVPSGDLMAQPSVQQPDGNPPTPPGIPPAKIERREITNGANDPRRRAVLNLGGFREGCPPWRFELSAKADGTAVFQVIEPFDRQIVLGRSIDNRTYEVLLGDNSCNFRIKVERNR